MYWQPIATRWTQLRNAVHENWKQLSEEDLDRIAGRRERLNAHLRERYGFAEQQADNAIDEFLDALADGVGGWYVPEHP